MRVSVPMCVCVFARVRTLALYSWQHCYLGAQVTGRLQSCAVGEHARRESASAWVWVWVLVWVWVRKYNVGVGVGVRVV